MKPTFWTATVLFSVAGATFASSARAGEVMVWGEAPLTGHSAKKALELATKDGLADAVRQVAGVAIESEFSLEQKETLSAGNRKLTSRASELLNARASGFVEKYEVVSREKVRGNLRVQLKVNVFESKLKADLARLSELIAAAGNPKLALELDGGSLAEQVSAKLQSALIQRGFEVVEPKQAEILVTGRIESENKGKTNPPKGLSGLTGMMRLDLRATLTATRLEGSRVLAAESIKMVSIGLDESRAVHRALSGRGHNFIEKIVAALVPSLTVSLEKTLQPKPHSQRRTKKNRTTGARPPSGR